MNNPVDDMSQSKSKPKSASEQCEPSPGASKQPWTADVDIYLTKGCPDPEFYIRTSLPIDPATDNIVFENNRRPGFNINFNLYDETGSGYAFPPQPKVKEACWSQTGESCPQSAVWQVFDPRRVSNQGKTLHVYNENPSRPEGPLGPFKYTLRVTNDGGDTFCDLDPGGDDKNGPSW